MAFTVEDGSGIPNANAYITVAYADTHHADRGNTAWTDFTTTERQSAIIRASEYIDKRFGRRFVGVKQLKEQGLEWPRLDAFDLDGFLMSGVDEVPRQIQKAAAEYAIRAAICFILAPDPILPVPKQSLESGNLDRDTDVVTGEVTRKRDKVGPLEEERWYQTASQTTSGNLGAGARDVQSSLLNDFSIPEYPEADLWIEELLRKGMRLARGD